MGIKEISESENQLHNEIPDGIGPEKTVPKICNMSTDEGNEEQHSQNTLLQIQELNVTRNGGKSIAAKVLWDAGSTLCFITFQLAEKLKLYGEHIELELITVGGESKQVNSKRYTLHAIDQNNELVAFEVLGIEQISTDIAKIEISDIIHQFTSHDAHSIQRPASGKIDILIGFQYSAYHPVCLESVGHLLLLKNRFGVIIAGSHPNMKERTKKIVQHATILFTSNKAEEFFSIESLGVSCTPACGGCRCGQCHPGAKNMSLLDEKELMLIKNGLSFDVQQRCWVAKYPWIKDPSSLPENRYVAFATLKSSEKRLMKNLLHADTYKRQIEDMLNREVARKISEDELKEYSGPKFYISHHDVLRPGSNSTAMRIVFNSSAKVNGISLNSCLAKGPSLLNNLLGILFRFREERFAFIGDISKMFHSIKIPLEDQMMHLFLWRDLNTEQKPSTYAMTAVNMGDRPAAAIAQTALRETAIEAQEKFPASSKIIIKTATWMTFLQVSKME